MDLHENTGLSKSMEYNLHVFGLSSFPFWGCCPLKGPVFVTGFELIVPYLLLWTRPNHFVIIVSVGKLELEQTYTLEVHLPNHERF